MLSRAERETIARTSEAENTWTLYTVSPSMMKKLQKLFDPTGVDKDREGNIVAMEFEVPLNCISIKKPRQVTDKMRAGLEKARAAKKSA